jgi:quinoprotein glucose dehydrogenase
VRYWLSIALLACGAAFSQEEKPAKEQPWHQYGGGPDQSKYVELTEFTKENLGKLEVAWNYAAGDGAYMFNPIVVDGVMYLLGKEESLVALDAVTGKELWVRPDLKGIIKTGINYWESKDRKDRRLIYCRQNMLEAANAITGEPIASFGENGATSLKEGLGRNPATIHRVQSTTPGQIFENLIVLGSSPGEGYFTAPGHVRAYDVITGKLAWTFHTIPWPGEYGYETWPPDAYQYLGGVNAWGEITIDEKHGIAFVPLGSPTYDYYGADRIGAGLFGNCILALDARTGKRLWHFQAVHHDLWDYDFCSAPQLITVDHEGKKIEAVAVAGKQGFLYVFERLTGKPLWPIEERPVPQSTMPGEQTWPTQPYPTVVPPFTRHTLRVEDLNPYFSPEKREQWQKRFAAAKVGLYEPLSDQYETIAVPGAVGGANRGNTAADPERGLVYIITQEYASVYKLKPEAPLPSESVPETSTPPPPPKAEGPQNAYAQFCAACHGENMVGRDNVPTLVDAGKRLSFGEFSNTVGVGKGVMPGFPHLEERALMEIYTAIGGTMTASDANRGRRNDRVTPRKYPPGIKGPVQNFSSGYGLEHSDLQGPPWSWMVAYDLNKGSIKWRRPLGHDPKIPRVNGMDLGLPIGSQRKGMVVTSNGLIFSTCLDGHVYAYDAESGDKLWTSKLPRNPEGLPAMYEAGGRQFLVICSMGKPTDDALAANIPSGYLVYSLPKP